MTPTRSNAEELADALLAACERGDYRAARQLLSAGVSPNPMVPFPISMLEPIPLNVAISRDDSQLVKLLISHGATCDNGVTSPLGVACHKGKPRMVRLLLALGADPNEPVHTSVDCRWTITPLIIALPESIPK